MIQFDITTVLSDCHGHLTPKNSDGSHAKATRANYTTRSNLKFESSTD
jgi:hypothetical protein